MAKTQRQVEEFFKKLGITKKLLKRKDRYLRVSQAKFNKFLNKAYSDIEKRGY